MVRPAQFILPVLGIALSFIFLAPTRADDSDIVEIEEHWQLDVGGPDTTRNAPQVTMIMSPVDHLAATFFAFTVNHATFPDFGAGGYQLQRWYGTECVTAKDGLKTAQLYHDGEVIAWVQRLTVYEGTLRFQVTNGSGETWGNFGGGGLSLYTATNLTKLNGYRPGISIDQSGIGFAGNRVSSLTLNKIRWKTADGQEHEMVAPIDIDSDLDP
jgi:hypothetical protein